MSHRLLAAFLATSLIAVLAAGCGGGGVTLASSDESATNEPSHDTFELYIPQK